MAQNIALPDFLYIAPYNGLFAFDKVLKTLEVQPTDEEERKSVKLLKYTARIVVSFAISYFSYSFIYYNAICFAFKSLASIDSYLRDKEVFQYRYTDYNQDLNKHIRHGFVDILLFFSSYSPPIQMTIVILYATFPKKIIEIARQAVYYKF